MPPGSLPRALDVIIRNEMVETVRPGDKAIFFGSLIVIPDMAAFQAPGERTLLQAKGAPSSAPPGRGVSGIATTGARELHYKLAFLANNVQVRHSLLFRLAIAAVLARQRTSAWHCMSARQCMRTCRPADSRPKEADGGRADRQRSAAGRC
jgi:hypothetical protein